MRRILKWGIGLLVVAGVAVGAFALLTGPGGPLAATISAQTPDQVQTVAIRAADSMLGQISASGSIAPVDVEHVVLGVDGTVLEVLVEPGDVVAAGDALLRLDSSDLELSLLMAELDVATAENALAQLQEPASATEIAEARADLLSAQEKLADANEPATALEIQAAQASVAAAWAKY
ncbi:MAG: biotin/lipoyl-binding protein, partial [Caldilineaceae bacterium]|nr:biotin/lipoyl-binding protein [Caldilineaceae bacterium]